MQLVTQHTTIPDRRSRANRFSTERQAVVFAASLGTPSVDQLERGGVTVCCVLYGHAGIRRHVRKSIKPKGSGVHLSGSLLGCLFCCPLTLQGGKHIQEDHSLAIVIIRRRQAERTVFIKPVIYLWLSNESKAGTGDIEMRGCLDLVQLLTK